MITWMFNSTKNANLSNILDSTEKPFHELLYISFIYG